MGISVTGHSGEIGSDYYDPAQTLMNILDQNIVTDCQFGAYFDYDGNTANSSSGIVDTVISYDFFSSNGAPGSCGLLNNYFLYGTTNDTDAYYYYNGNTWQNFWDANSTEP